MELFLSLQLIFDSARSLETLLSMLGEEEIIARVQCRSIQCVRHMIEDISRQTSLYSSRLLMVIKGIIINVAQIE